MLKKKSFLIVLMTMLFLFVGAPTTQAANVSHGVYHSQETVVVNKANQSVNQLSINLNQPHTTIDVGIPSPLHELSTVSNLAKLHTQNEHHVVGAINASFFHFSNGFPSYLLMKDGKIHHLGAVSTKSNDYMYTPAAFGITSDNTAKIGKYGLDIQIEHGTNKFNMTSLNRERGQNESIFYTSSYSYSHTRTNNTGWEVVVQTQSSVEQQIALGQKVSGKVTGIRERGGQNTSAAIPQNGRGFVLSATDGEIDKIKDLKIGDTVSVSYDIDNAWKNSKFMLATGPLLVQDGKVNMSMDTNSPNARQRTARTAVATDATGKRAFFVTVDSNRNGKTGMTLNEFADYLAKQEGVYNAINLDGGGSTAMVARLQGNVYPTLVNRPADGYERGVSAILEAVSTAPYSQPRFVKARQSEPGIVAVGASVGFTVDSALDQYYNVLKVDQTKLQLKSVTNGVGKIENNQFVGVKAGSGTVNADYDGANVSIPVTVTDQIDELVFTPSEIRVGTNEQTNLNVKGTVKDKQVIFNDEAISLTASGNIGTINGRTFTAGNTEATGTITASYGKLKKTTRVSVTNKPAYLGSFESLTGIEAATARANASLSLENKIQPIDQNRSVKLSYDFTNHKDGISAAYLKWTRGLPLPSTPKKVGLWVYGDGNNHWLRGALTDANKQNHIIDFTKEGGLDWTGWKYVEASIPQTAVAPYTLNQIYVAETSTTKKDKGFILFDKIQVHYSNSDNTEPAFVPSTAAMEVPADKKFTVTFTQAMNESFFTDKYVYVEDTNGLRQPVTVSKTTDPRKVEVSAPATGYEKGQHYRLVITHFAQNSKNVPMVTDHITEFKIK